MSKPAAPDRRRPSEPKRPPEPDRRAGLDRRRSSRLRVALETAVPVIVRCRGMVQWGVARNVSDGGMLIELREPPSIGARVEIQLAGIQGSSDAPDAAQIHGEVRHQVAWNFSDGDRHRSGLTAVGVRFVSAPEPVAPRPHDSALH